MWVYSGKKQYADPDTKPKRRYVIVRDNGRFINVSKLKSIKIFDETGKNADCYLVEINSSYPGLSKRTGVDKEVFSKNRISKQPLSVAKGNGVFNDKEEFALGSHDLFWVM